MWVRVTAIHYLRIGIVVGEVLDVAPKTCHIHLHIVLLTFHCV